MTNRYNLMNKTAFGATIVVLCVTCSTEITMAQGTLYVSSVDTPIGGNLQVASDSWLGESFATGNFAGGYSLESVQLRMNSPSGSAGGFSVNIYSASAGYPGAVLPGTLNGPSPSTTGVFSYAASGISLSPSTTYFVVLKATTASSSGAFLWSYSGAGFPYVFGGWDYGPFASRSTDGDVWTRSGRSFQLAITATPIPEPAAIALLLSGWAIFLVCKKLKVR